MKEKEQRDCRMRELEETGTQLEVEQQEAERNASVAAEERRALESIQEASIELASVIVRIGWGMNRRTTCTHGMNRLPTEIGGATLRDSSRNSSDESLRRHTLSNNSRMNEGRSSLSRRSCYEGSSLRLRSSPK